MAKIIITRKSKMAGSMQNHDVYLYDKFVGELKNGGVVEFPVDVGTHFLTFKSKLKAFKTDATFTAVVNNENEVLQLKAGFNFNGEFIISYADDKPHFVKPVVAPSDVAAGTSNTTEKASGIRCSCCGSTDILPVSDVTTKGKDFNASDACCGYMLCGPLGLLFGAAGKGKQTVSTTYWVCKNCGNKFKA